MALPVFYLLAGPNGAGKSSLYRAAVADGLLPADAEFINADLHEGGHDVPAERVLARYPRTLKNLTLAVRQVDLAMLYDSGSAAGLDDVNRPVRVAVCRGRETKVLAAHLPAWATTVLA